MTKRKCKCPPNSPFHWQDNLSPSMFLKDHKFNQSAKISQAATNGVEKAREEGRDIGHLPGVTTKLEILAKRMINVRQFTIYSKAGKV